MRAVKRGSPPQRLGLVTMPHHPLSRTMPGQIFLIVAARVADAKIWKKSGDF
jgi:hypothetical protein